MMIQKSMNPLNSITPNKLQAQLLKDKAMMLLDVRSPEEFAQNGRIPNALLLPLPMLSHLSHRLPQDRPLVIVCRSGRRSQQACHLLRQQGFQNVLNLAGGLLGWQAAQLPIAI
ncbi:MAG: rhodanese-like domain-containing protein [Chloroflexota bacterium]